MEIHHLMHPSGTVPICGGGGGAGTFSVADNTSGSGGGGGSSPPSGKDMLTEMLQLKGSVPGLEELHLHGKRWWNHANPPWW